MASVVQKMALCGISSAPNIGVAGSSETWVSTYKPGGGGGGGGGQNAEYFRLYSQSSSLKNITCSKGS